MRDLSHSGFHAYTTTDVESRLMTLMVYAVGLHGEQRVGALDMLARAAVAFEIPPQRIRELLAQYGFAPQDAPQ
jgi:hypothetical protein